MAPLLDALRDDLESDMPVLKDIRTGNIAPIPTPSLLTLKEWDVGVFSNEIVKKGIYPKGTEKNRDEPKQPITEGTFTGTSKALTEMYKRIENRHASYFDMMDFEPSVLQDPNRVNAKDLFQWSDPKDDQYPPHLEEIPKNDQVSQLQLFDLARLVDTGSLLISIVPEKIMDWAHGEPDDGNTIAEVEQKNVELREKKKDIRSQGNANVGDRSDWYTDAVFAQQQFTGTNPNSIQVASDQWRNAFIKEAVSQGLSNMEKLLSNIPANEVLITDYSYFRDYFRMGNESPTVDLKTTSSFFNHLLGQNTERYCPASVTLYTLDPKGVLHPIAICIDYKVSLSKSVVIFNQRLSASDPTEGERADWPWRYAKTCAQVSDWVEHEVGAHLTKTHMIEEATIVGASRAFGPTHPIYMLLSPHWIKTLSLNAAARKTLMPSVISHIIGVPAEQSYTWCRNSYANFDFQGRYVPADLSQRGFSEKELIGTGSGTGRLHNYGYARNILLMWRALHTFVASYLDASYATDVDVAKDPAIQDWVNEMHAGGQMPTFPNIKTKAALIDACTMCIHIASPQHTAVNYTQDYWLSFVINKPPALFSPIPTSLDKLLRYKEVDLCTALPIKHPKEWLLASHLPHLLTFRVAEDQTLINYALSLQNTAGQNGNTKIRDAAKTLWADLMECDVAFKQHSIELDDKVHEYSVLYSEVTANSILI